METQEEVMGSKDHTQINKGKRTKRQRPQSPLARTMASSSSSTGEAGFDGERASDNSGGLDRDSTSPTTSLEFTQSTEEEEDMANCLILLAKGRQTQKSFDPTAAAITATKATAGFYVYECKTCNRCFPSFQALGGHRASHKKLKASVHNIEEKRASGFVEEEEYILNNNNNNNNNNTNTILSLQIANRGSCNSTHKHKVHECSVCGAEFSSGQALGGHMRRHRTFASNNSTTMSMASISSNDQSTPEAKKPRNILSLDLNLPAPDDDFRESKFPFASKEQVIVFSASPLVDCHY